MNQPVLSNELNVSCSMKQRESLMGFKLKRLTDSELGVINHALCRLSPDQSHIKNCQYRTFSDLTLFNI